MSEFRRDERGIEGLPIRLIVSVVVAPMSVMMNMISGLSVIGVSELDTQPYLEVVTPGEMTVAVRFVDPEGAGVANATVVARSDTVAHARTNASGVATMAVDPSLGPNQADGEVALSVKLPAGSKYVDRSGNTNAAHGARERMMDRYPPGAPHSLARLPPRSSSIRRS